MIKVFIADDHKMFREGLKTLIKKDGDIEVVGEAQDGIETLEKVTDINPDVLLLDLDMPGLGGLEVIKRLVKIQPKIKILVVSMHKDGYLAIDALKSGASGFLVKDDSFARLTSGIKALVKNELVISKELESTVLEGLIHYSKNPENKTSKRLTNREREILRLIAEGFTNQKIADSLFISVSTVDTHRKNLMKKLNIHSIAGLVKYAVKNRIISI
jgi:two-component system, NarL family, response regulator NreC